VLECGRRFADDELPKSTWDLKRYFWAPKLGMKGIFRLSLFRDVAVLSGSGVGGGSLGYANTLYRAPAGFYDDPQWAALDDWAGALAPHYDEAERMLGAVEVLPGDPADELLREFGREIGADKTYAKTRVGVYFGTPAATVPDPFFGGEGPDRTGCRLCGRCMVGCPYNAKNTLVKNYLWFAERDGVEVMPERTVTDIRPLGAPDGSDGYAVTTERTGAWLRKDRRVQTARGVVLAAGALGTIKLLAHGRLAGSLPRLSDRVGKVVRTNSEAILAVTLPKHADDDMTKRVAISSSVYPEQDTHIETVTYGDAGDSMNLLFTLLVGDGTKITRPLKLLAALVRHPVRLARTLNPRGWSRRTIIVLVMQALDNAMELKARPARFGGGVKLQTAQDPDRPNPTFIPVANQFAAWLAKRTGGVAQSSVMEAMLNVPTTAHILGGAVIGPDPSRGVIDAEQRVYGYENLLVCDGAAVPANVGVNPSLTITAMAELAMSRIQPADVTSRAKVSNTSR
jgi:cholesterol oxidase